MTDQTPPSRGKRRLLLAGAGVGGPLIGLLLLMTVFSSGDDVAVGTAQAPSPRPRPTTTVPAPPPAEQPPLLAATSDPFHQLVTTGEAAALPVGPSPTPSAAADPAAGGPAAIGEPSGSAGIDTASGGDFVVDETFPSSPASSMEPATTEVETAQAPTSDPTTAPTVVESVPTSPVSAPPTFASSTIPPTTLPTPTGTVPPTTTPPVTLPPTTTPPPVTTAPPATTPPPSTTPPLTTPPATTSTTMVMNSGRPIAFTSVRDGNQEIYTIDPDGRNQRRLTKNLVADRDPTWSPDGLRLAFVSDRAWRPEIWVMAADGSSPTRVTVHAGSPSTPSWAKDGESIAFESTDASTGNRELFVVSVRNGAIRQLTSGACAGTPLRVCPMGNVAHRQPAFSPDGSRIAFVRTDRTGAHVYVMHADGSQSRSIGGTSAANPAWAGDGRSIAYDDIDGIRVVSADGGDHRVVPGTSKACPPVVVRCPVFVEPSWSGDGTRLAVREVTRGVFTGEIFVIDLHEQQQTRLNVGAMASNPKWFSPSPTLPVGP